jgi:alpha-1,3-rhamnosyl/mannosyltransferase
MRVGFGVSALCKGLTGGGLDGIGNYTREMLWRMAASDAALQLVPFAFGCAVPGDLGSRIGGNDPATTKAIAQQIKPGIQLGRYSVNTAVSVATGVNFPGIRMLSSQVDLIHATDHYIPKCKSVPMLATIMDAIPLSHPHWLRPEFRKIKNMLMKRAENWADEVITISDYSKIELSKWVGIALDKITVIPLGVDERWFRDVAPLETDRVRAQYQLPETFFVSVGTLQPRKNVEGTINAHRALSPAERLRTPLIIIGRAGWKCEAVMRLIDEDTASGAVRWLQHVPDADLLPVLKLASALMFPSLGEGFGLPVLEAFAASVPVITSNTTSLPEVAGDAAISVDPMDIDQIAKGMQRVLEDQELTQELKRRGLARAREFTWQACADATLKVYQRMV